MSQPFTVAIPVFKAYKAEDGNHYIDGLGGDDEPDYDPRVDRHERLTRDCIKDFQRQVTEGGVVMIPRHYDRTGVIIRRNPEWDDEMGTVVNLIVTPHAQMFPRIKLDMDNSKSLTLYKQIRRGKKLGLSWGAKALEWHNEHRADGLVIRVFDKMELWHFVPTTRPVSGRTLNTPLRIAAKSVDWDDAETIEVDETALRVDYPEREEVLAVYKSWGEQEGGGEVEVKEVAPDPITKSKEEESMALTFEEAQQLSKCTAEALAPALKSLAEEIAGLKSSFGAIDAPMTPEKLKEVVEEAVKAQKGDDGGDDGDGDSVTKSKEEIADIVKDTVNKALETIMTGLKSKQDAGAGEGGEDTEAVKALQEISAGKKTIDDFPPAVQRKLEDLSAAAFKAKESAMPGAGVIK